MSQYHGPSLRPAVQKVRVCETYTSRRSKTTNFQNGRVRLAWVYQLIHTVTHNDKVVKEEIRSGLRAAFAPRAVAKKFFYHPKGWALLRLRLTALLLVPLLPVLSFLLTLITWPVFQIVALPVRLVIGMIAAAVWIVVRTWPRQIRKS